MPIYAIACYEHHDFAPVVALLRAVFPGEPLSEAGFARRVLLDPNFDPQGAFVARHPTEGVIGFLPALTRRRPLEDAPSDIDRGGSHCLAWRSRHGAGE